jgi:hypothetical protein
MSGPGDINNPNINTCPSDLGNMENVIEKTDWKDVTEERSKGKSRSKTPSPGTMEAVTTTKKHASKRSPVGLHSASSQISATLEKKKVRTEKKTAVQTAITGFFPPGATSTSTAIPGTAVVSKKQPPMSLKPKPTPTATTSPTAKTTAKIYKNNNFDNNITKNINKINKINNKSPSNSPTTVPNTKATTAPMPEAETEAATTVEPPVQLMHGSEAIEQPLREPGTTGEELLVKEPAKAASTIKDMATTTPLEPADHPKLGLKAIHQTSSTEQGQSSKSATKDKEIQKELTNAAHQIKDITAHTAKNPIAEPSTPTKQVMDKIEAETTFLPTGNEDKQPTTLSTNNASNDPTNKAAPLSTKSPQSQSTMKSPQSSETIKCPPIQGIPTNETPPAGIIAIVGDVPVHRDQDSSPCNMDGYIATAAPVQDGILKMPGSPKHDTPAAGRHLMFRPQKGHDEVEWEAQKL